MDSPPDSPYYSCDEDIEVRDFPQEEFGVTKHVEKYDQPICETIDKTQARQPVERPQSSNNQNSIPLLANDASTNKKLSINSTTGYQYELYVGNLTWWTTGQDIVDSVRSIGVSDLTEVKFFEHRENGQSKSFCIVKLGSEKSLQLVKDELPKKELHGQFPVVTFPTKQTLLQPE